MKYLVILADGMADEPQAQLKGLTPLQAASTPNLDKLARTAHIGQVNTIPADYPPGSDVANLSVLGYNPAEYYTGRSPLEAVSMGVELSDNDLAIRCNLVTLSEEENYADRTMIDYSSGEISTAESHELMKSIAEELGSATFQFYPGISYRHLLVWRNGRGSDLQLTPPHDIIGQPVTAYLPSGNQGALLLELMMKSQGILRDHPVNQQRKREGHPPATSIWLWGEGVRPSLPTFQELYGLSGSVVAAVDLVKGLGICAGLKPVTVEGATGAVVTNFAGKIDAALQCLHHGDDFVYVHIESPDEAGHQGNLETKIWSIEQIDQQVIGPLCEDLASFEHIRVLVMPDHPTPLRIRTHSSDPVPYLLFDSKHPSQSGPQKYDEVAARQGIFIAEGHQLMRYFIKG
ncbi:MAG TPA: cofactor-independent phosphoglycerate mutase [Syntrophomonadaceae bacterium]|nr:cofactor-independent phosphoglycerate mutase [Syntrophomonadaceae bacterium]HQE23671.1 cofactor-independent phosphoglycerate mutase [Syntrophomonadaceae bacterium]